MFNESLYKNEYLNWGPSSKKIVEKTPQYPYYSLPFRGDSEYKKSYEKAQKSQKRPQSAMVVKAYTAAQ